MDLFGLKGFSDYLWNLYEPDTLTKKESETVKDEEIDMDEGANDLDSRCERSTKNEEYYTGQNRINHMDKNGAPITKTPLGANNCFSMVRIRTITEDNVINYL